MSTTLSNIIDKYQGLASSQVIKAVKSAAEKTGVDFKFLMEKAATESSFNPSAKSKTSSARGLYQFVDQTWLSVVKKYGEKYGLGDYADKISMKDGKACVTDCAAKDAILKLRNNPEISALMAGEFSAENKQILETNTNCDVGSTELYLAHFMGAGGASKFLNCRAVNGDAVGAELFPQAAKANKNVFYNSKTGQARSLDEIYNLFDKKFTNGTTSPSPSSPKHAAPLPSLAAGPVTAPAAAPPLVLAQDIASETKAAQALPSFDDANDKDDIIWNDDPRFYGDINANKSGTQKLSPVNMMIMTQMQETLSSIKQRYQYNS